MGKVVKNNLWTKINLSSFYSCGKGFNLFVWAYHLNEKGFVGRWVYCALPIAFETIMFFVMMQSNVFLPCDARYSFVEDISNSLCLTLLFLIAYYLSAHYFYKIDIYFHDQIQDNCIKELIYSFDNRNSKQRYIYIILTNGLAIIVSIISVCAFAGTAENNGMFWIRRLSTLGRILYCFFLGLTWYHSVLLLIMVITSGYVFYISLTKNFIYYLNCDYNRNESIIQMRDILICNFSYGLFYILGAFVFIINDVMNGLGNTFSDSQAALILVMVILLLTIIAYIPLYELCVYMRKRREDYVLCLNTRLRNASTIEDECLLREEIKMVLSKGVLNFSLGNILVVVSSILIPLVGIVVNLLDIFN